MPSWFRVRRKSKQMPADETLIRVCLVSRDPTLVEEVHKDLFVGFSTRGGYNFESDHPDFQQCCDVLFVDLRAVGLQADTSEGFAFIDAIRTSASRPPIVALCDPDAADFAREVMRRGAYDKLTAPLNVPQLRLALQRAYEFRLAEAKLENFLSEATVSHERPRAAKRKARPSARVAASPSRPFRRARWQPSQLAVGFVLGCVLFFAGLVTVRTILSGMGDALASAGFAADSGRAISGGSSPPGESQSGTFGASHIKPLTATADFGRGAFDGDLPVIPFSGQAELAAPGQVHSSLPGYEPAAIIERVSPRYSLEA